MEDILNKNIFDDSELIKYGPDYYPRDTVLRMQLRRDMVRESNRHKKISCTETKTKIKKKTYNNSYKVNSEIAKIRSFFRSKDAKNKLVADKYLKHTRSKKNLKVVHDEIKFSALQQEIDSFIQDSEDNLDLKIENDLVIELREKETVGKNINIKNKINEFTGPPNKVKEIKSTHIETCKTEADNVDNNNRNTEKNNLQTLLIMMALSSEYNEIENDDEEGSNEEILENVSSLGEDYMKDVRKFSTDNENLPKTDTGINDFLTISSLYREATRYRKQYIEKKYFEKWKSHVKMKAETHIQNQRKQNVNKFLEKLSKAKRNVNATVEPVQKAKMLVRDYNSYQHRFKVQKHIIALQKAKLEQQNKVIEELKYNKIVEASRQSLDNMKEEVRKTYYEIDRNLKPKIKCLTNELNIKEIEEPSLILNCLKVPQFLQRMEARAREREEKHAIIRERRKQMEEDKLRMKQQAELMKAEMDKEEKMRRLNEMKEKRRREKLENIRKKQHAERMRALTVMADLHYEKSLMAKYGIRPFQRLIIIKRENIEKAKSHYKFQLMKNIFLHWMFYTEDMWFDRNFIAEEHYRKKLLKKAFDALKKNHYNYILKKQVAEDYYDLYVAQLVFRKFRENSNVLKNEFEQKWENAVRYYECNLLFKVFSCWRTLPALNALKREQEARKLKWRQKVLQVVPDYQPPDD